MRQSSPPNKLSILDARIMEGNLGNDIILQAVERELNQIFPKHKLESIPRQRLSWANIQECRKSTLTFLGGTNALSGQWWANQRYGIPASYLFLGNLVLMGCGWWQWEESRPDGYSQFLLKNILQGKRIHALRDSYTQKKLHDLGIDNTLVTACPSLWGVLSCDTQKIPSTKADTVLFTLTDYATDKKRDSFIVHCLQREYKELYFFPQGSRDLTYFHSLPIENKNHIHILKRDLQTLDQTLTQPLDYVGTRLHAGIRAIGHNKRSLIIAIDNRAACMGDDFNLPVLPLKEIHLLKQRIHERKETKLNIPHHAIKQWKEQFLS